MTFSIIRGVISRISAVIPFLNQVCLSILLVDLVFEEKSKGDEVRWSRWTFQRSSLTIHLIGKLCCRYALSCWNNNRFEWSPRTCESYNFRCAFFTSKAELISAEEKTLPPCYQINECRGKRSGVLTEERNIGHT